VSELHPFSSDGAEAHWVDENGALFEHATLTWDNEAWTVVVRLHQHRVEAVYRFSPTWQMRQFILFRDLDEPDLWLGTDGHARWGEVNGAHRPELDGCTDVVVAGALFPLTANLRRLPLEPGDAAQLRVLDVDPETLGVVPATRVLHRLDQRRWRIENPENGTIEFEVDEYGVAIDTPNRRRLPSG